MMTFLSVLLFQVQTALPLATPSVMVADSSVPKASLVAEENVYLLAEQMPFLLACKDAETEEARRLCTFKRIGQLVASNIQYPTADREAGIEGKVLMSFVIRTDGSLGAVEVVKAPSESMAEEGRRIVQLIGKEKWVAGMNNNTKVKVKMTLPILFATGQ